MEATGRLRRLLYLVPAVLARQGVPVAELAKELDIDEATLREDINLLSMVGPPQGGPDEFLLLTIDEEDDCVYADLPQGLTRPLRLTAAEAFSLTLGLRALAGSGVRPYEDAVARLLAKIRAALGEASPELLALERESVVETEDHTRLALLSDLHRAITAHKAVSAQYHSASRGQTEQRGIDPYGAASSETSAGPSSSRRRMARRTGSESAKNTRSKASSGSVAGLPSFTSASVIASPHGPNTAAVRGFPPEPSDGSPRPAPHSGLHARR